MTLGEYRVGITFNPGGSPVVQEIKYQAAKLIDLIDGIGLETTEQRNSAEVGRLKSLAMTHVEDAAMWAVKAATKPPRERDDNAV